jgi:hypothetical protein
MISKLFISLFIISVFIGCAVNDGTTEEIEVCFNNPQGEQQKIFHNTWSRPTKQIANWVRENENKIFYLGAKSIGEQTYIVYYRCK